MSVLSTTTAFDSAINNRIDSSARLAVSYVASQWKTTLIIATL